MKDKFSLTIIFLILLFPILIPAQQTNDFNILIIYGNQSDRDKVETMIPSGIATSSVSVESDLISLSGVDMVILASSISFSMEDSIENQLVQFMSTSNHYAMIFSPYLDDFSNDQSFGVESYIREFGEQNTTWTLELQSNVGNHSSGDQFTYEGKMAELELLPNIDPLVNSIGTTHIDGGDLTFPFPAVWNMNDARSMIGSVHLGNSSDTETVFTNQMFEIEQLPDFIDSFLSDIFMDFIISAEEAVGNLSQNDEGNSLFINFSDIDPIYMLLIGVLALLVMLYRRILDLFNWLTRKTYGLLFVVIGAFYNVQDRALNYNDVMMNTSRLEIIDFLQHVGEYGAHLREIKSITNMGSGSLLWHLQVLEDFRLIEKIKIKSYTVFLASDYSNQFNKILKEIELNLQSKYIFPVIEVLQQYNRGDKIDLSEIENSTGINRRSLRRLVKKMEKEELVELEKTTSIKIIIRNIAQITELSKSLRLRNNFEWDDNSVQIERVE